MIDVTKLKSKTLNIEKLVKFGFLEKEDKYIYYNEICNGDFLFKMQIDKDKEIRLDVIDKSTNEPYSLFYVDNAQGSFISEINNECKNIIDKIELCCFDTNVYTSLQTKNVVEYIKNNYGDKLEYLWQKFPDYAIWRRKDNKKWYGVLMTLPKYKLDEKTKEKIDILNVRVEPEKIDSIVNNQNVYKGYHMNKKHWISLVLDNSIDNILVYNLIDKSFILAKNK